MPRHPPCSGPAATLRDVAGAAGVSIATVSRVLTGVRSSAPATRDRVLSAAAQLDYRPSGPARALKLRHSRTIGLLVTDIENPYFPEIVRAVEDAAHERGIAVLLCNATDDPQRELAYINLLLERRVDGIIVAASRVGARHAALLERAPVPVVLVNSEAPRSGLPAITSDNRGGARHAAEHLINLGHRRIGHITAPRTNAAAAARLLGVRDALRRARLDPDQLAVAEGDGHVAGGERAMSELLEGTPCSDRGGLLQRLDRHWGHPRGRWYRPLRAERHQPGRFRRHRAGAMDRSAAHHHCAAKAGDGRLGLRSPRNFRGRHRARRPDRNGTVADQPGRSRLHGATTPPPIGLNGRVFGPSSLRHTTFARQPERSPVDPSTHWRTRHASIPTGRRDRRDARHLPAGDFRPGAWQVGPSAVVGHVYVNNNTAGHNSVSGFDRHADGTLYTNRGHTIQRRAARVSARPPGPPARCSSPGTVATSSP